MQFRLLMVLFCLVGGPACADEILDLEYRGDEDVTTYGDYESDRPIEAAPVVVSVETCGKLFGSRQTATRLRDAGFSLNQTIEETLNRAEWRDASIGEVAWAMRVVTEVYENPGSDTSYVVRECRVRSQGLERPEPILLPVGMDPS